MGKIVLILGPHGVGKTTLFSYAKQKNEFLVYEGFKLPTKGYDMSTIEGFMAYQNEYTKRINICNSEIKKSEKSGLVVRSIEESSYYFHFWSGDSNLAEKAYREVFDDKDNIKVDAIVYLEADREVLSKRYSGDAERDMQETFDWYENEYERYTDYWKHYPKVQFIDTNSLTTSEIYDKIVRIVNQ